MSERIINAVEDAVRAAVYTAPGAPTYREVAVAALRAAYEALDREGPSPEVCEAMTKAYYSVPMPVHDDPFSPEYHEVVFKAAIRALHVAPKPPGAKT